MPQERWKGLEIVLSVDIGKRESSFNDHQMSKELHVHVQVMADH